MCAQMDLMQSVHHADVLIGQHMLCFTPFQLQDTLFNTLSDHAEGLHVTHVSYCESLSNGIESVITDLLQNRFQHRYNSHEVDAEHLCWVGLWNEALPMRCKAPA